MREQKVLVRMKMQENPPKKKKPQIYIYSVKWGTRSKSGGKNGTVCVCYVDCTKGLVFIGEQKFNTGSFMGLKHEAWHIIAKSDTLSAATKKDLERVAKKDPNVKNYADWEFLEKHNIILEEV